MISTNVVKEELDDPAVLDYLGTLYGVKDIANELRVPIEEVIEKIQLLGIKECVFHGLNITCDCDEMD